MITISLEHAVIEIALIERTIIPLESALALLLALEELPNVLGLPIVPAFLALSMLSVIQPVSVVLGPIGIHICAHTVSHIIGPFALVDVPICVSHSAFAVTLAVFEHAFVLGTVGP